MLPRVFPGRYTAAADEDIVVLLIGMRINRPWKVREWWPVLTGMPAMVRELEAHPEKGLLHAKTCLFGPLSPGLVQYWRSFEALERFARDPGDPHLPAWREFNRRVRGSGDVGIWHETYRVAAGDYEAIYGNMPRWGLGRAREHLPVGSASRGAAVRLGVRPEDEPPVEGY